MPIERAENAAFFGSGDLPEDLAERHRGLDLAVLWLADPEGTVRRHFETLGARHILQAPALPPKDGRIHATDHLLGTLAPFGIRPGHLPLSLGETPDELPLPLGETPEKSPLPLGEGQGEGRPRGAAEAPHPTGGGGGPAPTLPTRRERGRLACDGNCPTLQRSAGAREQPAISPRPLLLSSSPRHPSRQRRGRRKCWPPERFAQVARTMTARGLEPILIEGPADEGVVAIVQAALRGGALTVLSGLVDDLAAILSLCHSYLGNDSGVTHLAAASGAATVALFGPTDPAVWGPRGRSVTIIRGAGGSLEAITVEQVIDALLHHDAAG